MSEYKTTVGLEIHAELNTKTKMFCACLNNPDEKEPNVNICPICLGHPGTLPFPNKQAIKNLLKVGVAVGASIADFTEFDRKNYFYPDIPKGYQISQYKYPLVSGGELHGVKLTRIHLEEDTAKSSHDAGDYSLVDFNRAGLPLLELVTEPVIHSAKQAGDFARELQLLFKTLGIAEANMEKGEMRVEANISVSKEEGVFGTKVEVKNLNSFRAVERAIDYEVARHIKMLEKGEKIIQETRGWDENKQSTFSQRNKENSNDYRYFPDPDLPKMKLSEVPEFYFETIKATLPELPWNRLKRYVDMGVPQKEAETITSSPEWYTYFDEVIGKVKEDGVNIKIAVNYFTNDYVFLVNENLKATQSLNIAVVNPDYFSRLVRLVEEQKISSRGAKDILRELYSERRLKTPEEIAETKGLFQKSDTGEIETMLKSIIEANPNVVADYKAGKEIAVMFFVGQVMKASKGSANPAITKELAVKMLNL